MEIAIGTSWQVAPFSLIATSSLHTDDFELRDTHAKQLQYIQCL